MLNFILNTFFTKKVIKEDTSKRTIIRKEVGERKTPTLKRRFVLDKLIEDKSELHDYFLDSKGLNLKSRLNTFN